MIEDAPFNDKVIRLIGIPFFGTIIPLATGLFGNAQNAFTDLWWGFPYFILLAFLIWQGNRFLLFSLRKHYSWLTTPIKKTIFILLGNIYYTAPLTTFALIGWYQLAGFPFIDWGTIKVVAIVNVICVIFVTHVYETVFLIKQTEQDRLNFEKLERAKAQSELEALKNQVDPHFIFNSLNTLSYLVETKSPKGKLFVDNMADVYRYILAAKDRRLVFLREELDFTEKYYSLLQIRFGKALQLEVKGDREAMDHLLIPPISLQVLVENVVKHNTFSEKQPLLISILLNHSKVIVSNEFREKADSIKESGTGLNNLDERYKLLIGKGIIVTSGADNFSVELALLNTAA